MSLSRADVSQHGEEPLDTPQHTCARDIRRQGFSHCRGIGPGRNRPGGLFKAAPEHVYDGLEALEIDVILRPQRGGTLMQSLDDLLRKSQDPADSGCHEARLLVVADGHFPLSGIKPVQRHMKTIAIEAAKKAEERRFIEDQEVEGRWMRGIGPPTHLKFDCLPLHDTRHGLGQHGGRDDPNLQGLPDAVADKRRRRQPRDDADIALPRSDDPHKLPMSPPASCTRLPSAGRRHIVKLGSAGSGWLIPRQTWAISRCAALLNLRQTSSASLCSGTT